MAAVCAIAWLVSVSSAEPSLAAGLGTGSSDGDARRAAVGSQNFRASIGYVYSHVDETKATLVGPISTSTLRLGELDVHTGLAEIVGTIPLTHSTGLRGSVRGSYDFTHRDLDATDPRDEDDDLGSYGVGLQAFLRDPDLGSLTAGASFDQIEGLDGVDVVDLGASAAVSVFVPDLGAGQIDYTIRFDYAHQELDGTGGSSDVDFDFYTITGEIGAYMTDDVQIVFGGRWRYLDDEFLEITDSVGMLNVRWLLPTPISAELSVGGSVGESEYKENPYPSDHRLIYGANLGLTFRFFSGRTLIENVRAFE